MQGAAKVCSNVLCIVLAACSDDSRVEALGTLERDRIVLKATADEIVEAQPIREGTMVTEGTLLVQLDNRRQTALVDKAAAEVARLTARLEELRNGARPEDVASASASVAGARAALTEAEANYERAKRLVDQKLTAKATLDSALAGRDEAHAALDSAQEVLLKLTNGTRKEQLDQGAAALAAAEAELVLQRHNLSELSITATRDAYLDSLPWNVGERVDRGSALAVLLANSAPYARVYIPEPYRAGLKVGMQRQVHIDGIEGTKKGTLRWIANTPSFTPYYALNARDRARLVYIAEFDLTDGSGLPTGVPVQVLLTND